jgi:DNA-binding winged helix-turn-helix (wHTH) protein
LATTPPRASISAIRTSKALMARVWPDRIVEENSLQSQISALRAALGAERDLIRTVSGRGYQFTGGKASAPCAGRRTDRTFQLYPDRHQSLFRRCCYL